MNKWDTVEKDTYTMNKFNEKLSEDLKFMDYYVPLYGSALTGLRINKLMESVDTVLYDPPYSPRQVSECYKNLGQTVNMQTTQASYWSKQKEQIGRIVKPNGIVITCSWNSGGIGKKYGFEIEEILLVPHGGWHNDTIVVVEKKIR